MDFNDYDLYLLEKLDRDLGVLDTQSARFKTPAGAIEHAKLFLTDRCECVGISRYVGDEIELFTMVKRV